MRWKTTLVLLLVTVGVGAYVSLYELKQPTVDEQQQQGKEIARLSTGEVSGLLVESPEAGSVSLRRRDRAWRLVSPLDARADDAQVGRILSELNPLTAERTLTAPKGKPFTLADFGLEPPKASLSASAGNRTVKVLIGEKTPVGANRYLKLADATEAGTPPAAGSPTGVPGAAGERPTTISVVTSSLFEAVNQPVDAYRSHELVDADPASVTQIALTSSKGVCALRKQGERWQLTGPITDDADSGDVSTMLGKLRRLRIERFVTNQPAAGQLAGWGLEAPSSRISITTDKPDKPLEVLIGAPTAEKPEERYAKRTDEPAVYAVKKDALEEFFQDPHALRSRAVLDIVPGQVTKVQLTWQGSAWTIEKQNGQWRASDGTNLDSAKTEDWLWKLRDLKLTRFVEDAPTELGRYGLSPPATEAGTPPVAGSPTGVPGAAGERPTEAGTPPPGGVAEGRVPAHSAFRGLSDSGRSRSAETRSARPTEGSPEERGTGMIQVWLKDQQESKELLIGHTIESGKSRYGKISGRPGIVELPEGIDPIVTTTPDSLRPSPPSTPESTPPSRS